jgi:hypothetical protein
MLLKTRGEKMSAFWLATMLMKRNHLNFASRDVDEHKGIKLEPRNILRAHSCRLTRVRTLRLQARILMVGRARSRLCSLNFFLTKPRLVGILGTKLVPPDEGTPWMTRMEDSRLRPSWRRMGTPQEQKVINREQFRKKDVIFWRTKPLCV